MVMYRTSGRKDPIDDWYGQGEFAHPGRTPHRAPGTVGNRLDFEKLSALALAFGVADVLRNPAASAVDFKVENVEVNPTLMGQVAQEIEKGSISVEIRSSGTRFAAHYSSLKTSRVEPGQRKLTGRISIGRQALTSKMGRAAIFHECVHALRDVRHYGMGMQQDEAVAYLADAIYMAADKITVNRTGDAKGLYDAAYALIDAKGMVANPGVELKWSDLGPLIAAVAAIPEYSGRSP